MITTLPILTILFSLANPQGLAGQKPGELAEVHRLGQGEKTLVLLPCMAGRWRSFDSFMERNRERYTMFAVTFPGYGGTPFPPLEINGTGTPWRDNAISGLERLWREEELGAAAIVAHSWGTSIAVEFAARHPELVTHLVNLDGLLFKPLDKEALSHDERLAQANSIVSTYTAKFADAEEWRVFNRSSLPDAERRALHHGMFMATNRGALLQYWRENAIVRLNDFLRRVECPILDLYTLPGPKDRDQARAEHRRADLESLGVGERVQAVTWFGTGHFVHELRPLAVDRALQAFLAGEPVHDEL